MDAQNVWFTQGMILAAGMSGASDGSFIRRSLPLGDADGASAAASRRFFTRYRHQISRAIINPS